MKDCIKKSPIHRIKRFDIRWDVQIEIYVRADLLGWGQYSLQLQRPTSRQK